MEEYTECTTYVSVNVCGVYTHIQIKQLLNDKINPTGIFLNDKGIKETPIDTNVKLSVSTMKPKRKRKSVETVVKKLDNVIMKVYAQLYPISLRN